MNTRPMPRLASQVVVSNNNAMLRIRMILPCFAVLALLASLASAAQHIPVRMPNGKEVPTGMVAIDTADYTVYSDLPRPILEEVLHRLEKLVVEYRERTESLSTNHDDRKLPLYLFSVRDDYIDQGGRQDSTGLFDGEHLLAYVGTRPDARAWHVIQHEAFHQYLLGKLGYEVPVWLNEGLAEYFSESIYTGDGFVSGVVPAWRLKRLQESLKAQALLPMAELIEMSHVRWNAQLRQENYDMAWSLVQFLAHGDKGAYQDSMVRYVQEARTERLAARAFREIFGDARNVEDRWKAYWLNYPEPEGKHTMAIAAVQTVCSFLARAELSRQVVKDMPQLEALARKDDLRQPKSDSLPISLLCECLQWAPQLGRWDLNLKPGPGIELVLEDGVKVRGRYTTRAGRVEQVEAWIDDGKSPPSRRGRRK
jgi:hypothetical protein